MKQSRRTFIRNSALGSTAFLLPESKFARRLGANDRLKVGLIGTGLRGQSHLDLLLGRTDVEVSCICDPDLQMIEHSLLAYKKINKDLPAVYSDSDEDWRRMLVKESIDAVIISTPWEWHIPMAVGALEHNLYVGLEVGGGFSVEEGWDLVRAEEGGSGKLYFLENVCFRRDIMAVLSMVRKHVFGEIVHLQGGYQHDLRAVKFNDGKQPYGGGVEFGEKAMSEAKWRTHHSVHRNGELYPTHGLGPMATIININRGNRLVSLTAMASKSRGLNDYVKNHPQGGPDHPSASVRFALGDVVTTMIKCQGGESILLQHDTNLPRPYSLGFRVQGTKGLWMDVNQSIHIEGISKAHQWDDQQPWLDRYDHPLWARHSSHAAGAGHGGMDWFLIHSFIEHAKKGAHPPLDVYDAATWRAITPLSENSIREGGSPQEMPDFTRGKWVRRNASFGLSENY